jgi:hypothetical protein
LHNQHIAGIESRPSCRFAAERGLQQHRRPHFAQALDFIEDTFIARAFGVRLRCVARMRVGRFVGDAAEFRRQCGEFGIQTCDQRMLRIAVEFVGSGEMAIAQLRPEVLPVVARERDLGECSQRIGDALHRGDDDRTRRLRIAQQLGDMPIAIGVGDAATAEFMRAVTRRCLFRRDALGLGGDRLGWNRRRIH